MSRLILPGYLNGDVRSAMEQQVDAAKRVARMAEMRSAYLHRLAWHVLRRIEGGTVELGEADLQGPFGQIDADDAGEGRVRFTARDADPAEEAE